MFDEANPLEEFTGAADATGTLDDEAAAASGEGAAVLEAEDAAAGAAEAGATLRSPAATLGDGLLRAGAAK